VTVTVRDRRDLEARADRLIDKRKAHSRSRQVAGKDASRGAVVVSADYNRWSLYAAPWLQPVATGRKSEGLANGTNKAKTVAVAVAESSAW
jgi:hypothetical protein